MVTLVITNPFGVIIAKSPTTPRLPIGVYMVNPRTESRRANGRLTAREIIPLQALRLSRMLIAPNLRLSLPLTVLSLPPNWSNWANFSPLLVLVFLLLPMLLLKVLLCPLLLPLVLLGLLTQVRQIIWLVAAISLPPLLLVLWVMLLRLPIGPLLMLLAPVLSLSIPTLPYPMFFMCPSYLVIICLLANLLQICDVVSNSLILFVCFGIRCRIRRLVMLKSVWVSITSSGNLRVACVKWPSLPGLSLVVKNICFFTTV